MSFNQIRKIEGLESLVKLTDLSLYNNEITVIENLDTLSQLKVLSLGNNAIKNLDKMVHYLRKFKTLRVLNLQGNKTIYEDPEARTYVIAFLKQLRYLDYKLITDEEVIAASLLLLLLLFVCLFAVMMIFCCIMSPRFLSLFLLRSLACFLDFCLCIHHVPLLQKQSARNQLENEIMQLEEDDRMAEHQEKEARKIAARQAVLAVCCFSRSLSFSVCVSLSPVIAYPSVCLVCDFVLFYCSGGFVGTHIMCLHKLFLSFSDSTFVFCVFVVCTYYY